MIRSCIVVAFALVVIACADVAPEAASVQEPSQDAGEAPVAVPAAAKPSVARPSVKPVRRARRARPAGQGAVVASVTDGDTIKLRDGRRVRLVQIDTPEVYGGAECGGRTASSALKQQLPPGTRVRLVADAATDSTDRYDRQLRYVLKGDRNLNLWLVQHGHAAPYFYDGERGRYAPQLERAARRAKARRLGMWGTCPNAVLDARRGVSTGRIGGSGASGAGDAAAGAGQLRTDAAGLPLAPSGGPDLDCADFAGPVRVTAGDPHRLDRDGDGIGCDS